MTILGGKKQFCSLYNYIKHRNDKLYEIVNDLCADGIFKSQNRYKNTFLYPSDKLLNKLHKMIEKDEDIEATKILRGLILRGYLSKSSDFNNEVSNLDGHKLDKPELLSKLSKVDVTIINDTGDKNVIVIYNYDEESAPVATELSSIKPERIVRLKKGGLESHNVEFKKITDSLISKDVNETFNNFTNAVASLLINIKHNNPENFEKCKYICSVNPILTWFFLVHSDLVDLKTITTLKSEHIDTSIWNELFNDKYTYKPDYFKDVNTIRKDLLINSCDKTNLPIAIHKAYKQAMVSLFPEEVKNHYKNIYRKILEDELKFMYEESSACLICSADIADLIHNLEQIKWEEPENHLLVCSTTICAKQISSQEFFASGPLRFVTSIYLLYAPLTDELIARLNTKSGGSTDGNPSTQKSIIYRGGATRLKLKEKIKKTSDIESLFNSLSKKQQSSLKQLISTMT